MILFIGRSASAVGITLIAIGIFATLAGFDLEAVHAFRFAFISLVLSGLCGLHVWLGKNK